MSTPFLKAIISSLSSLFSETPFELIPLNLTFVKSQGTDLVLNDGKYDYQTESFLSISPRKIDTLSQYASGSQIIFDNYHLEFRLRKNTHHIDLWLYADSSKASENQTSHKIRLRIDLSQCEELLQNPNFKNYSSVLKNDIIKIEHPLHIKEEKKEELAQFIPFQSSKKVELLDYFGVPYFNEHELKRGIGVITQTRNLSKLEQAKKNLRKHYQAILKKKNTRKVKKSKILKVPNPKLVSPPPAQNSKTNLKWAFDLETIKAWKEHSKKE